jgi:hypothetical protein
MKGRAFMLASDILTGTGISRKMLALLFFFCSLKAATLLLVCGVILAALLYVFLLILDALYQICGAIAQVWAASGAVEKLLILIVLWLFLRSVSPGVARLCKPLVFATR